MLISVSELRARARRLSERLRSCDLCPRDCRIDRFTSERGECGAGVKAPLSAALAHHGEEPPISGSRGAGTIFFGGCNLHCCYCQNYQISFLDRSHEPIPEVDAAELAAAILQLQHLGCHNIEFVTPTHVVPQMLEALAIACDKGLRLPVIYNSGGYDAVDVLRELEGIVDIYLPDLKYADAECARALSGAPDYWEIACGAIQEMLRQNGAPILDADGILTRGVVIRHLVLPRNLARSDKVLAYIAGLDPQPALSLMAQYYPNGACDHPRLQRPLHHEEYREVCNQLADLGLDEGWIQDPAAQAFYWPDFDGPAPFKQI